MRRVAEVMPRPMAIKAFAIFFLGFAGVAFFLVSVASALSNTYADPELAPRSNWLSQLLGAMILLAMAIRIALEVPWSPELRGFFWTAVYTLNIGSMGLIVALGSLFRTIGEEDPSLIFEFVFYFPLAVLMSVLGYKLFRTLADSWDRVTTLSQDGILKARSAAIAEIAIFRSAVQAHKDQCSICYSVETDDETYDLSARALDYVDGRYGVRSRDADAMSWVDEDDLMDWRIVNSDQTVRGDYRLRELLKESEEDEVKLPLRLRRQGRLLV